MERIKDAAQEAAIRDLMKELDIDELELDIPESDDDDDEW